MHLNPIPYTPFHPIENDALFKNQEMIIRSIKRFIQRPSVQKSSCAMIGGYGMGKTSLILRIKRELLSDLERSLQQGGRHLIPIFIDLVYPEDEGQNLFRAFLRQVIIGIRDQVVGCLIQSSPDINEISSLNFRLFRLNRTMTDRELKEDFSDDLWDLLRIIEREIGDSRIVLLIDNVHRFMAFNDLRTSIAEFLVEILGHYRSGLDLKPYLSVVLACQDDLHIVFPVKRTEPLFSVMEKIHLSLFDREISLQVIREPLNTICGITISQEVADEIYRWAGGHPRLLHQLMLILCEQVENIEEMATPEVETWAMVVAERNREIADQTMEYIKIKPEIGEVLDLLHKTIGPIELGELQKKLPYLTAIRAGDILLTLKFLGVITEFGIGLKKYGIFGEVIKYWIQPTFEEDHPLVVSSVQSPNPSPKYDIHIHGSSGIVVGDETKVDQSFKKEDDKNG